MPKADFFYAGHALGDLDSRAVHRERLAGLDISLFAIEPRRIGLAGPRFGGLGSF